MTQLNPCTPLQIRRRRCRIAVVGGSLTGPLAALLLLRAGFEVSLFEAVPAAAQQGGLIGLEHPALDILDQLGIAQNEFVAHDSETVAHITVCRRNAREIRRHRFPGRNTTWPLLHTALTRRLPAGVLHTGAKAVGLHPVHGRPTLTFAGGGSHAADLVVFADGRSSTGRRLLDSSRKLHYAGYVAHRGQTCGKPAASEFLRYEPDPNPGIQFNLAPIPNGSDWTFYLPATPCQYMAFFGAPPERRLYAPQVSRAARAAVDTAATRYLPDRQAAVVHATTYRRAAAVVDIDPPTRMVWPIGHGHAVLLGDALAPVRPHTARGANNGIEQAAGLSAALRQYLSYGADLATALDGCQQRLLPAAIAAVHAGPQLARHLGLHPGAA